jgi:hypothetical protein
VDGLLPDLGLFFGGFVGPRHRTAARRTYDAYVHAWRVNGERASAADVEVLRESFKEHSAPGAYIEPDGEPLAPWLAAWRAGLTPRAARSAVGSRRRDA